MYGVLIPIGLTGELLLILENQSQTIGNEDPE